MALEPCKVCGVLNSSEAETCLSCGFPTKGKKRPVVFQIAAIILVLAFAIPLIASVISAMRSQEEKPPSPSSTISSRQFLIPPISNN